MNKSLILSPAEQEELRICIVNAYKSYPHNIEDLAEKINLITQSGKYVVTGNVIYKWGSSAPECANIPPQLVWSFCLVTDSFAPLAILLRQKGLHLITDEEKKLLEFGRLEVQKQRALKLLAEAEIEQMPLFPELQK